MEKVVHSSNCLPTARLTGPITYLSSPVSVILCKVTVVGWAWLLNENRAHEPRHQESTLAGATWWSAQLEKSLLYFFRKQTILFQDLQSLEHPFTDGAPDLPLKVRTLG